MLCASVSDDAPGNDERRRRDRRPSADRGERNPALLRDRDRCRRRSGPGLLMPSRA